MPDLNGRMMGFDESTSKIIKWSPEEVTPPIIAMAGAEDNVLLAMANAGLRRHRGLLVATGGDLRFYEQSQVTEAIENGGRALQDALLVLPYTEILQINAPEGGEELGVWTAHHDLVRFLCDSPRGMVRLGRVLQERTHGQGHFRADRRMCRQGRRFALLHGPQDTVLNERAWTRVWLQDRDIALVDPRTRAGTTIRYSDITSLSVAAPPNGDGNTMLSAAATDTLRQLRRRKAVRAVLRLDTNHGELDLATCDVSPEELDAELAPARRRIGTADAT
ncbi:hypothetical protein RIF23_16240 [Lipingzhangella sp. LS1_29]|uniref:Uncharacterized protein n=1 Tax=Lipingzhangella rawalii TaxID=2055835 RepID=A0ABU2H954_9ACTN|nr:hypothetical protein [Lipingzhangella rawalii]MDS1271844.1 hypothetical protein [Lipingzhangella rawalii]